ncbi:uncharacterized protein DNG_05016 [Cephalotrichum gorgonifer]|uniref:Uncharacterized protein n=1 Tax=Cephalotrichum gorgonifer TaxID=2041049 RepID=A0AAE8MYS6_9PEZI|nr:uncharacterized protein DNG_05016 [Cephalotrichum gorgonifer]
MTMSEDRDNYTEEEIKFVQELYWRGPTYVLTPPKERPKWRIVAKLFNQLFGRLLRYEQVKYLRTHYAFPKGQNGHYNANPDKIAKTKRTNAAKKAKKAEEEKAEKAEAEQDEQAQNSKEDEAAEDSKGDDADSDEDEDSDDDEERDDIAPYEAAFAHAHEPGAAALPVVMEQQSIQESINARHAQVAPAQGAINEWSGWVQAQAHAPRGYWANPIPPPGPGQCLLPSEQGYTDRMIYPSGPLFRTGARKDGPQPAVDPRQLTGPGTWLPTPPLPTVANTAVAVQPAPTPNLQDLPIDPWILEITAEQEEGLAAGRADFAIQMARDRAAAREARRAIDESEESSDRRRGVPTQPTGSEGDVGNAHLSEGSESGSEDGERDGDGEEDGEGEEDGKGEEDVEGEEDWDGEEDGEGDQDGEGEDEPWEGGGDSDSEDDEGGAPI